MENYNSWEQDGKLSVGELWDKLLDLGVESEDALQLITDINGYSTDTLYDVLYSRTGYHSLTQGGYV